ncbi:MAG: carboxylesterase family protein [Azospirillaceae bacterium]|nr:carboxylesterase family protein [Azospirillaceae bacterium]
MGTRLRSIRHAAALLAGAWLTMAPMVQAAEGPTVTTTGGTVQGESLQHGGALFRGIPFAQPPVANLRWQPPQPIRWTGVRPATQSAVPCLQSAYGWNDKDAARSAEDCLYLDVRTPALTPPKALPVMVWIHGGANRAGSGGGYSLSTLTDQGVVLVTVQYRLDLFGFLSLPELTAQSPAHASGNYGLMDQIAALRWVRDNIARFGGDPANVTIFGESAGSQDVGLLMLSPQARGLFTKAIEQSGTAGFGVAPRTLAENEALGRDLLAKAGAKDLAQLRAMPGRDLLNAAAPLIPPTPDASFIWLQAVVDGQVLTETPAQALAQGHQAPVPLMIGANARELGLHGGPEAVVPTIRREFGTNADRAMAFYGIKDGQVPAPDPRLGDTATQLASDLTFRCPSLAVATWQAATGVPVWVYHFDHDPAQGPVSHGSDLPFVFSGQPAGKPGDDRPTLPRYWANFARTGNPNGTDLTPWPAFAAAKGYLEFSNAGPVAKADLRGPICGLLTPRA